MSNDLYFIPRIFRALHKDDARPALEKEFAEIQSLGQTSEYQQGYDQFQRFMEVVAEASETHPTLELILEKDGLTIGRFAVPTRDSTVEVNKALPGTYRVILSTGRVLWEGQIAENDLLIPSAKRPGMRMAAHTGTKRRPKRKFSLLSGEIVLRCFVGKESGVIEIAFDRRSHERRS